MAMFREHIGVGALVAMVVVVAVYTYALITDWTLLAILFGIAIVGSFLPDVDSDTGTPFYLVYGTASVIATGVVLYAVISETSDWRYVVGVPLGALMFFWIIVGSIIKKCTKHRGIFHSIPATLIAATGTYLVAEHLGFNEISAVIFAGGMAAGYLAHLILDELHAGITLDGIPFNPKSSLGSALKFFSKSTGVNLATYSLLGTLAYSVYIQSPNVLAMLFSA